MSRLIDSKTGVQMLPPVEDERRTLTLHAAQQCIDADLRTKSDFWSEMGKRLVVEA